MNVYRTGGSGDHRLHGNGVAAQASLLSERLRKPRLESGSVTSNTRQRRVILAERIKEVVSGVVGDVGSAAIDVVGRAALGLVGGNRVGLIHAIKVGRDGISRIP